MTTARLASLRILITAHEMACIAIHGAARAWGGDVAEELRRLADHHHRRAVALREEMRGGGHAG